MIRPPRITHLIRIALVMIVLAALGTTPTFAQVEPPTVVWPAGFGCSGFDLGIYITSGGTHRPIKTLERKNGVVRIIDTGKGNNLTFENMTTHKTLSLSANGSNGITTQYPDGTQRVVITGHTILNLYPTDIPAGPSTTLYVGRVVYTIDANGIFEVQQTSGQSLDICASVAN